MGRYDNRRDERIRRGIPPRHSERWTEDEEDGLVANWLNGATIAAIADRHERSWNAIAMKLEALGFQVLSRDPLGRDTYYGIAR